jgi:hypothetical protein
MSKILVDTIDTRSGTSTLTVGSTNSSAISLADDTSLASGKLQSNFLYPAFHVVKTSSQSIATATGTDITYDTEKFDTASAFSSTTFTVPSGQAGKYYFYANNGLDGVAPSRTFVRIMQNGTGVLTVETGSASSYSNIFVGGVIQCAAGDTFKTQIYHDQGSNQNTHGSTARAFFGGYRIGT